MVCMIDLIDEVETIENSKRLQRDQGAGHREPFRYSYIWERKAAFFSPWQILAFHMTSSIPTGAHKTTKNPKLIAAPSNHASGRGGYPVVPGSPPRGRSFRSMTFYIQGDDRPVDGNSPRTDATCRPARLPAS